MSKELLDKTEAILCAKEEFYIPAKIIWSEYLDKGAGYPVDFTNFMKTLKNDPRFYVIESQAGEGDFTPGPLIGLTKRIPSKEEIKDILIKKTENIITALQEAYKIKPDDSETEKNLLDIMIKTKNIKEKISRAFDDKNG